ncbi:ABC transporter permease [Actinoplanes aureus]|uniref:ABC transporter permease n=1 Tax=Actinoplanes aureus TaxID=2792083 RepID=A0A931C3E4_9ACTN|nr:ABC transporter permease [Actinoplanes aureus]MBG0562655.1 ABC transporter permease [Actinoplanes aureus]
MSAVRAELRKLLGLPTAWVGLLLGLLAAPALVILNAGATRRAIADGIVSDVSDLGLQNLGIGVLGAMILGVVTVSSEYTATGEDSPGARQLTTTLTAVPRRTRLLAAKAAALSLVVAVQGTLTAIATLALTRQMHGTAVPSPEPVRVVAAVLYWTMIGLLAYAITLIARNGIITLTLLIVNSAVVSFSYLLTKVTPLAAYLPDIVGAHMFLRGIDVPVRITPVTAGVVMTAWVAGLLAVAGYLFHRRDA